MLHKFYFYAKIEEAMGRAANLIFLYEGASSVLPFLQYMLPAPIKCMRDREDMKVKSVSLILVIVTSTTTFQFFVALLLYISFHKYNRNPLQYVTAVILSIRWDISVGTKSKKWGNLHKAKEKCVTSKRVQMFDGRRYSQLLHFIRKLSYEGRGRFRTTLAC